MPADPAARRRNTPSWRHVPAPDPALEVVVVVPVRDEATRLAGALRALVRQRDALGRPLDPRRYEVLVLANNCEDASADVARAFAERYPSHRIHVAEVRFPPALAHVGQARACLMAEARRRLRRVQRGGRLGVIASTDADSAVAPDWLAETLAAIEAGAHAVGGRIVVDPALDDEGRPGGPAPETLARLARIARSDERWRLLGSRLEHLLDPQPHDVWPRHHQHFGASLALTTEAYDLAGGVPAVPFLEDEALVRAMRRRDLRVRHSPRVRIRTSSRLHGRVAVGLSQQRREWAHLGEAGIEPLVPHPLEEAELLTIRARLRRAWLAARPDGDAGDAAAREALIARTVAWIAARRAVSAGELDERLRGAATFGALWEDIEARRSRRTHRRHVPLDDAIDGMRRLVAHHEARRRSRSRR